MTPELRARFERLLIAARRLRDVHDRAAQHVRGALRETTGLSAAGIDLALSHSLETDPSEEELVALSRSVEPAATAHVLLSANVFVAAHRALALALAAAPRVVVRPSRREPHMIAWLCSAAPGLFDVVDELAPEVSDLVFAYGSDATMAELRRALKNGVRLRAHGSGFGLVACEASALSSDEQRRACADALALDLALFDQRGCLSPRVLFFEGDDRDACALAAALAAALERRERDVPLGTLSVEELAQVRRFRDLSCYAGTAIDAGSSVVGVLPHAASSLVSPVGRNLAILPVENAAARARALAAEITTFAAVGSASFVSALRDALPEARHASVGRLQRPAFDGPADLRTPR